LFSWWTVNKSGFHNPNAKVDITPADNYVALYVAHSWLLMFLTVPGVQSLCSITPQGYAPPLKGCCYVPRFQRYSIKAI
jgi:hypothetical protein